MDEININKHIAMMKERKQWIDANIESNNPEDRELAERYQRARLCWFHEGLEVLKNYKISKSTFREIYLDLWGVAALTDQYDKKIWTTFRKQLEDIGVKI